MTEETKRQYVDRKLNESGTNISEVCRKLEISRSNICRVKKGGKSSSAMIRVLHDYFKKLGD